MQNSHIIVPELSALLVSLIDFSMDTNCFKYPPLPWQPDSVSRSLFNSGWSDQWSVLRRSPHHEELEAEVRGVEAGSDH